jgi:hypothetical protein
LLGSQLDHLGKKKHLYTCHRARPQAARTDPQTSIAALFSAKFGNCATRCTVDFGRGAAARMVVSEGPLERWHAATKAVDEDRKPL